jgi:DNA-binding GntR family transcriptional regulator
MAAMKSKRTIKTNPIENRIDLSTVDRIIVSIKENIREGIYAPGQRLVEPDLIRSLRVSRGSVREALRRLESEGVIEHKPFIGATVRKMSRSEVAEFSEIRELLEGLAARRAAEKITPKRRKDLLAIERSIDAQDSDIPYATYNLQFHNFIIFASEQSKLPMMLERTQLGIIRLQFQRILDAKAAIKRSREEHRKIVSAILRGDANSAERLMRLHVRNSTAEILGAPDTLFVV